MIMDNQAIENILNNIGFDFSGDDDDEECLPPDALRALQETKEVETSGEAEVEVIPEEMRQEDVNMEEVSQSKVSKHRNSFWQDFTKVPADDCESKTQEIYRVTRTEKYLKKAKKPSKDEVPLKNSRKKYTRPKKVDTVKIVSDSSDDSDDEEYKNKRRKLADAVTLDKNKADTTSLKDRIAKMLNPKLAKPTESYIIENSVILTGQSTKPAKIRTELTLVDNGENNYENKEEIPNLITDLINGSDAKLTETEKIVEDSFDMVDAGVEEIKQIVQPNESRENSDDDLESLRQLALNTKASKLSKLLPGVQTLPAAKVESEDEDSDTEELRMICLRSALLKKAIEMKKKQKMQKRLSQHSIVQDDLQDKYNTVNDTENTTDIENVDMEMGSDADEKSKDGCEFEDKISNENTDSVKLPKDKDEEIEEDEDLLRAKLLTSLSKNLPNLVEIKTIKSSAIIEKKNKPTIETIKAIKVPEDKKFIIKLGDSDSEGEHEATKNLTKMHMKLSEQTEFQQKLDQFLKSTRMEVEKNKLPDVVQSQALPKPSQKFVPKAMNHLPKSEQIEYKNLVKRMAELEKIKQARQLSLNSLKKPITKDTLKPHNVSANKMEITAKKLEEKIATSRKMIAEESAKMLKLKEEATKLSQRYKIVSNELRNITTAITLNKKQQRTVQNGLSKIRLQHSMLLKSSMTSKHSTVTHTISTTNSVKDINSNKKQKENNPSVKEHKIPNNLLKSVKVSVINDLNKETIANNSRLSVEIDVTSNKKVVKTKTPTKERIVDFQKTEDAICEDSATNNPTVEKGGGIEDEKQTDSEVTDYISPLDSLGRTDWKEDPNAFLCPFEVGGTCRDADCKFLHLQK